MNKFILASGNPHKSEEFAELFSGSNVAVEAAPKSIEVDETGNSFEENAFLKAKAYYDAFGTPVLADDSGLVVSALPDELGVYSARFGGDGLDDEGRARLLLDKMSEASDRSAYFVCYLCFMVSPKEVYFFEGRLRGEILNEYLPGAGFGYDPVFTPSESGFEGGALAQSPEWKAANSHRSLAVQQATQFFFQRDCQTS